jgi:predicted RecB family nuclease
MTQIAATQVYDYVQCPHRVLLDATGDPSLRDEPNPFIELLWKQGVTHEQDIINGLPISIDLHDVPVGERERETRAAMAAGMPLIYRGRLSANDKVGEPDLLELGNAGYVAGDIKSGAGLEGGDEGEGALKRHYAFQLAHYESILEESRLGAGVREPFIIDRTGTRVPYNLMGPQGVRKIQPWWEAYVEAFNTVRGLLDGSIPSRPALGATCKLCHWYSHCKQTVIATDDLTMVAELGRSRRDVMAAEIPTVHALAACDPEHYLNGKKTVFAGIGPDSLRKFQARAELLITPNARPYLKEPVTLPIAEKEVYFDIEADPMRDVVYLHGFVERLFGRPDTARFVPFFAAGVSLEQETGVFAQAWAYLQARLADSTIYYYSKYERTAYKKLAEKCPGVCSVEAVEETFALSAMVDLYTDVVKKSTEWPCYDQSIKTLAQFLGFRWRDTHPSGAASIEWYSRWIESGDPAIRQRILDYNEDDCLATGVVVDGVRTFAVRGVPHGR